jgi:hypothetical protein
MQGAGTIERFALTRGRISSKGFNQMAFFGRRMVWLLLTGGMTAGMVPTVFTAEPIAASGDRIQFSDHEMPRGLVPAGRDPLSRAGRIEALPRGGSMGGVVEVPGPSSGSMMQTPNARMLELIDQRRNWIYATEPSAGSFGSSAEQTMGVRSYDLSEAANSPRGGARGFLQSDRSAQQPAAKTTNPLFDTRRDGLLVDSYGAHDFMGSGTGRLLEGQTRTEGQGAGYLEAMGISGLYPGAQPAQSGTVRSGSDFESAERIRSLHGVTSIQDLLRTPESLGASAGSFDPIDFRIDTTRQELNPINPQRLVDGSPNRGALDMFGGVSPVQRDGGGSALSEFMDRLRPDEQGSASLAPVVRAPAATQGPQPIKRFGEYPSRRF